jgi:hypothetical protein
VPGERETGDWAAKVEQEEHCEALLGRLLHATAMRRPIALHASVGKCLALSDH